jgi:hypothetical protein
MNVHVDEARDDEESGGVDDPFGGGAEAGADRRDPSAVDKDIEEAVEPFRRVDDAAAPEQDHRFLGPPIRTGSAMKISSLPSVSLRRTRTASRREVGRTLPT